MGIQHSLTNQSNFFLLSILSLFYFPTVYPLISSTFKKSISFNPTPNTPIKMQYTLSTASALLAALSLTSAAPMPSTSTSTSSSSSGSSSSSVTVVLQLEGFDAASTLRANLDATTVNNRDAKSAALQQAGPWCAGFTDAQATQPVPALNGDGIFDSANEAIYSQDEAVTVGSFWCAQTRGEVEDFVARATNGQGSNDNQTNNGNGNANTGNADATGPVHAGTVRNLANGAISIDVVGNGGNCQFFDAQGQTLNFGGDELVQVASFECQA